jgi:hypothetical protein
MTTDRPSLTESWERDQAAATTAREMQLRGEGAADARRLLKALILDLGEPTRDTRRQVEVSSSSLARADEFDLYVGRSVIGNLVLSLVEQRTRERLEVIGELGRAIGRLEALGLDGDPEVLDIIRQYGESRQTPVAGEG